MACWNKGAVPSQYRLVGPKPWAGAREAILGAEDRIVYAISGGKHLRDIKKNKYVVDKHLRKGEGGGHRQAESEDVWQRPRLTCAIRCFGWTT